MILKKGQRVFQVLVAESKKTITEYEIVKVNSKTVELVGKNGEKLVKLTNFTEQKEEQCTDSFVQFATTLQNADRLSIELMDVVLDRKYLKLKAIKKTIEDTIVVRNTAPKIKRMQ